MPGIDELFPITLTERPLRFGAANIQPAELLRQELKRLAQQHRNRMDQLLLAIGDCVFHLSGAVAGAVALQSEGAIALADGLEIVSANLQDLLAAHQVRIDDRTGTPWGSEDHKTMDVRGSTAREEVQTASVTHTECPAIFQGNRLIRKGAVILETPIRS